MAVTIVGEVKCFGITKIMLLYGLYVQGNQNHSTPKQNYCSGSGNIAQTNASCVNELMARLTVWRTHSCALG